MIKRILLLLCYITCLLPQCLAGTNEKQRVIVTSDGEIDDECSIVRFLLYANEWDIEGIITSSSQYHWQGHKWAGDDWINPYLDAYEKFMIILNNMIGIIQHLNISEIVQYLVMSRPKVKWMK